MMCFVGLGSNMGDRLGNLQTAVKLLAGRGIAPKLFSSVYETSPVGCPDPQPDFLNAAVGVETDLDPGALVEAMLAIEHVMGRTRPIPHATRNIDLDVLLMGATVAEEARAIVPHPRLHERLFVLAPLREIAPEAVHPVQGRTVAELYAACLGQSSERVRLFAPRTMLSEPVSYNSGL